ncbi:MAG: hypothetical protein ACE141_14380 [Bryobacteraceae bacterium]
MIRSGYVKLWRRLMEDPLWTQAPASWLKVALGILMQAAWRPGKWFDGQREIPINPGFLVTSRQSMCRDCGVSPREYRGAMSFLRKTGFCDQVTTKRYTIITIRNWASYQGGETSEDDQTTKSRPSRDQVATTSEEGNHHQEGKKKESAVRLRPSLTFTPPENGEPKKPISSSADDDDLTRTPTEQLQAWIKRRHPEANAEEIAALVRRDLEEKGLEISGGFLAFIRDNATGRSTNPPGLYRKMVRRYSAKLQTDSLERSIAMENAMRHGLPQPAYKPSCDRCKDGVLAGGGFCDCKVGLVRRELEERRSKGAAA